MPPVCIMHSSGIYNSVLPVGKINDVSMLPARADVSTNMKTAMQHVFHPKIKHMRGACA